MDPHRRARVRYCVILSDRANPQHYVSFAQWESFESTQAWRTLPGFGQHFTACRELCNDLYAGDYAGEAAV